MPDPAQGTNKHLRIGGQNEILMFNREVDDATLPDLSPQGVATSVKLATNTWECLEYKIGKDGSIETWLNGNAVPGLTVGGGASNPNANGWSRSSIIPKPTGVYFGWESYGGETNTFWYDDVVISESRVGCSADAGSPGNGGNQPGTPTSAAPTTLITSTVQVPTTTAPPPPAMTTQSPPSCSVPQWQQCGGINVSLVLPFKRSECNGRY